MSTARHPEPRRTHTLITPEDVTHWLAILHEMADTMRTMGDRRLGAVLDLMADDVEACAADDWHDRAGHKVTRFEFRLSTAGLPDGDVDIQLSLTPIRAEAA